LETCFAEIRVSPVWREENAEVAVFKVVISLDDVLHVMLVLFSFWRKSFGCGARLLD
jgi:hypothetical protein